MNPALEQKYQFCYKLLHSRFKIRHAVVEECLNIILYSYIYGIDPRIYLNNILLTIPLAAALMVDSNLSQYAAKVLNIINEYDCIHEYSSPGVFTSTCSTFDHCTLN